MKDGSGSIRTPWSRSRCRVWVSDSDPFWRWLARCWCRRRRSGVA